MGGIMEKKQAVKFGAIDALIMIIVFIALLWLGGIVVSVVGTTVVLILVLTGVIKTHS